MASVGVRAGVATAVAAVGAAVAYKAYTTAAEEAAARAEAEARNEAARAAYERCQKLREEGSRGAGAGGAPVWAQTVEAASADLLRASLEALRATLRAAAAERPAPLLCVPLLGTHEGVDAVMLAALALWGDYEAWETHATAPFLAATLRLHVPTGGLVDVEALSRFGTSLAALSEDSTAALGGWLLGLETTRALAAAPGLTAASATASPSVGSATLDDFYNCLLQESLQHDPTLPLAALLTLPKEAGEAAAAIAVARALGFWLYDREACDVSAVGRHTWPQQGEHFVAEITPRAEAAAKRRGRTATAPSLPPGDSAEKPTATTVRYVCGEAKIHKRSSIVLPAHIASARGAFLARVLTARRARVLGRRVAAGALRGASLQHCQALAGEPRLCLPGADGDATEEGVNGFDVVHALHQRDTLQLDTRRADVAAMLTHGLLQRVPPPEVPSSAEDADNDEDEHDPGFCGEEEDDKQPRSKAGRRRATLRLEVVPFVSSFVELLDCKLLATPVNANGRTPLQCVPASSACAESQAGLFHDYRAPTSVLRVRLRRHEAAVAHAADAAARVPRLWLVLTATLSIAMVAIIAFAAWQACASTVTFFTTRLPTALTAWLPVRVIVAATTVASTRTMLLMLSGALLGSDGVADTVAALNRATYLAAARACGWRVPLLRDAAALEARCAAQLRAWACRALIRDMRNAVRAKRIGARRALAIMAATAAAAEPSSDPEATFPMPGSAAEVEVFLALPCDEAAGGDDAAAETVGLCGVDQIIQGALEGVPPALLHDVAWREAPAKPAAWSGGARRARKKRHRAKQAQPAERDDAAAEGADDSDDDTPQDPPAAADGNDCAPETPPPPPPAPRARDRSGWRTVEAMLVDGGWRFVRCSGHVVFKRDVRLAASGAAVTQSFVAPCTPSDARAGRHAAAQLRRLDQGVVPIKA